MRTKLIVFLLAATAASPALAQSYPDRVEDRQDAREDRQDAREDVLDAREDRRDEREDRIDDRTDGGRADRVEDRQDRREDVRDAREDRQDRREDWRDSNGRWENSWRRDIRYDWRGYRTANRAIFGWRYNGPRGYNYRRYGIGARLGRVFLGASYWLNDPSRYRLPRAYGNHRWIRYYNDAVLVDTRTGMIIDVEHDFFY